MSDLPLVTSAFLNVTNACNACCVYCFANHSPEYLDYSVAQDAADFLIKNAEAQGDIPSINFFGGEPMLCWDSIIVPLTKYVREKCGDRFNLSMTSNCTLINRERAKFMKDNGIGLLFSMDGGQGTQNLNRPMRNGRSSFDILENKIPIILASSWLICRTIQGIVSSPASVLAILRRCPLTISYRPSSFGRTSAGV